MNIIYSLLHTFFQEESTYVLFMILTSFLINILQTNGVGFITSNIIQSVQNKNAALSLQLFYYFMIVSMIYIGLYIVYKYLQTHLLTKLRQWIRYQLIRLLLLSNNDAFNSEMNFTTMSSPINRVSSVCFLLLNDIITYLIPNITYLIIVSLFFLWINRTLGTGFIIGNALLITYCILNLPETIKHNEMYEKHVNQTESYLIDILNNIDKIIYRGQTNMEIQIFSVKTEEGIQSAIRFYSNANYHGTMMVCIMYLILFSCSWYLITLFYNKEVTTTLFITCFGILLVYQDKIMTIIQQIPDFIEFIGRSDSVLKHFRNIRETGPYSLMSSSISPDSLVFRTIVFQDVSYKYPSSDVFLFQNKNMKIDITGNKIIGITGLSGKGKSTFAKLLLRMYPCTKGIIMIDGIPIDQIDPDYLRQQITYVNQTSKLFDKKIMENILYGCPLDSSECQDTLREILPDSDTDKNKNQEKYPKIRHLFQNLDIHKKGSGSLGENLSGGQRQVIHILGGLIHPSKILILDEPTNALDPGLKNEVLRLISDFKRRKQCILIITHDEHVFSLFDEKIQI